jgi:hypothetical protein
MLKKYNSDSEEQEVISVDLQRLTAYFLFGIVLAELAETGKGQA